MTIATFRDINVAYDAGQYKVATFRKAPTQTTAQGIWFDLCMSPGNPVPNYYAATPLAWTSLKQSTDGGLAHGGNVAPLTKYLHKLLISPMAVSTVTPLPLILLDYLGFYPFIDMADSIDLGATSLPRYTTGAGVQIMAVEVASQIGGAQFYCTYTNQDGTGGRVTQTVTCNTQTVNGTLINTAPATAGCIGSPFLPLQIPDTGVRSVENVTFLTADVGLITIVLVKPLATMTIDSLSSAIYSPMEHDFAVMNGGNLPAIVDDAYLNFICLPSGTLAGGQLYGTIETIWN